MTIRNRRKWRGLAKDGPGRVRLRLAKLLEGLGIKVDAYDLWCQEGGYRRRTWDLACWGTNHAMYEGKEIHLCCWDTMTKCVSNGIVIVGEWSFNCLEISRNTSRKIQ